MEKNTLGKTPAAEYLVRVLNELGDQSLTRSVGKRITASNSQVADMVYAYSNGQLPAKTMANCLRLMREEITNEPLVYSNDEKTLLTLVDKLRRNVQIGNIKAAIRLASVARKCETVMTAPNRKGILLQDGKVKRYAYFDKQLNKNIAAGFHTDQDGTYAMIQSIKNLEENHAQILHERSLRRCTRQGKPWTKGSV